MFGSRALKTIRFFVWVLQQVRVQVYGFRLLDHSVQGLRVWGVVFGGRGLGFRVS